MFEIVKVVEVAPIGEHRLRLVFSDGSAGEHDFAPLIDSGGSMVELLRDPAFFARVFIELGIPTWPNGFDLDAIKLHMDMSAAGELNRHDAEGSGRQRGS